MSRRQDIVPRQQGGSAVELAVVNQPGQPGVLVDSGGSAPNDSSFLVGRAAFCYVKERKMSKVR